MSLFHPDILSLQNIWHKFSGGAKIFSSVFTQDSSLNREGNMRIFLTILSFGFCFFLNGYAQSGQRCVDGDCINGRGEMLFENGGRYVGQFREGRIHGHGTIVFPDGGKYTGQFLNGEINGRGVMTFSDGSRYTGQFRDGVLCGQGSLSFPDGSFYKGQFDNGTYNGKGLWVSPYGIRYEGEFKNGKFDGRGTYSLPDGSRYIGYFRNNAFCGRGTWNEAVQIRAKAGRSTQGISVPEQKDLFEATLFSPVQAHPTNNTSRRENETPGRNPGQNAENIAGDASPLSGRGPAGGMGLHRRERGKKLSRHAATNGDVRIPDTSTGGGNINRARNPSAGKATQISDLSGMDFSVQVGAFLSRKNAEKLAERLRRKGYTVHLIRLNDVIHRPWYAVRLGNYPSRDAARKKADAFSEKEKMTAVVRPVDTL